MTKQRQFFFRRAFIGFFWSILFFVIMTVCCVIFIVSTSDIPSQSLAAFDEPITAQQEDGGKQTGIKIAYAIASMAESDVFWGLLFLSMAVSAFGAAVEVLPGTDLASLEQRYLLLSQKKFTISFGSRCPNCDTTVTDSFCPHCGQQKFENSEIALSTFLIHAIPDILNIDKKFFRTLWLLLSKPGRLTNEFLWFHRAPYSMPLQLYVVIAAVFFFVSTNLDFDVTNITTLPGIGQKIGEQIQTKAKLTQTSPDLIKAQLNDQLENYISLYTIIMVVVFAFALKVFYNYWDYVEHLIFSLHFITVLLLFWMLVILLGLLFPVIKAEIEPLVLVPSSIYLVRALRHIHPSLGWWRVIPVLIWFVMLFLIYTAVIIAIGLFLL